MTASPYASTATDTACGRSFPCARCTASLGQVCRGCSTSPSTGSATSIQLAQGKTPPMYPLRQAGQQLQGHGRAGLHREMPACGLFRQTLGVWSRRVLVYGMSLSRRMIHGSGTSQTRHDHARHSSRNTAIAGFDHDAEQALQPQPQDGSQMAQPRHGRGCAHGTPRPTLDLPDTATGNRRIGEVAEERAIG